MTEYYPRYGIQDRNEVGGYGYVANIVPIMITCGRSSIKRGQKLNFHNGSNVQKQTEKLKGSSHDT